MDAAEEAPVAKMREGAHFSPLVLCGVIVLAVLLGMIVLQNILIGAYFPHLSRVTTDFSSAYLRREINALAAAPPETIFLGDSVLWGYRLQADQTAVALLGVQGCACRNFAFKKGSPPNYYALVRLLQAAGVRPKAVVLEVNQKIFNRVDTAYKTLHPAVGALAAPLLTGEDRAMLDGLPEKNGWAEQLDRAASSASALYAMRSDIRETLYGDTDANPIKPLTADAFEGTYDLSPLREKNIGVRYLKKTVDLLQASGVPVLAFMTPANHTLLHEYIDTPEYRANGFFLQKVLQRRGVRVLDLDAAFPASSFLDEVHLKPPAQRRLAALLFKQLPK